MRWHQHGRTIRDRDRAAHVARAARSAAAICIALLLGSCGRDRHGGALGLIDGGGSGCSLRCPTGTRCEPGVGCLGTAACATDYDCRDMDSCTADELCDSSSRRCVYLPLDGDHDGEPPIVCGGRDCDDANPFAGVGMERCDGFDNDCDGVVDEAPTDCPAGSRCTDGYCECTSPGSELCGVSCVDTRTDVAHCGDCYTHCGEATSCVAGACVCDSAGLTYCSTTCVDLTTSPTSCGSCGHRCSSGSCMGGVCEAMDAGPPPRPDAGRPDAGRDAGAGACPPGVCNLVSGGCPAGEACYFLTPSAGGDATPMCDAAGTGRDGTACTYYYDCAAGFICVARPAGASGRECRHYCCSGSNADCPSGQTCAVTFTNPSGVATDAGYCRPAGV